MIRLFVKIIICISIILGLGFLVSKVTDRFGSDRLKRIYPSYVIGGLDSSGEFLECKDKLVTAEIFAYNAIEIIKDFDSTVSYELFFYDNTGKFLSKSGSLNGKYEEKDLEVTKFVRIVITPSFKIDETAEIKVFNKHKYTFDLKIKVKQLERNVVGFGLIPTSGFPHEYTCLEGMTWEEFVNSEYNKDNLFRITTNGYVVYSYNGSDYHLTSVNTGNNAGATASDVIVKTLKMSLI